MDKDLNITIWDAGRNDLPRLLNGMRKAGAICTPDLQSAPTWEETQYTHVDEYGTVVYVWFNASEENGVLEYLKSREYMFNYNMDIYGKER